MHVLDRAPGRMLNPAAATALAAALLSACSLAPKYETPSMAPPAAYREAGDWQLARPADASRRGDWWLSYSDATLDGLQAQLAAGNQDRFAAIARLDQARAIARRGRSDLFPSIGLNASADRGRASKNARTPGTGATTTEYRATADIAWEIDVFGRLRNTSAAARDRADASAGDLAALELALRAELANQYFVLRGADATRKLLGETVTAYERALTLTRNRYDAGIAAASDVDRADTQLANARSQLAAATLSRATAEHAIAVLLGQAPGDFALPEGDLNGTLPVIDAGLPSTLLERRPDIASAERRVAAANAEIGIARAAWFPVFTFGGSAGYASTRTPTWFEAPSELWSLGPAIALPLLDVGGRAAGNARARAAYDESVANYRQTVLEAYREVEDNLAALHHLADQRTADEAASGAAQRALAHANRRYGAGIADYVEVTTAQTAALQAQRAALDSRVQELSASTRLVRALGGGWVAE